MGFEDIFDEPEQKKHHDKVERGEKRERHREKEVEREKVVLGVEH